MNITDLVSCAEAFQRPCFHLVESSPGEKMDGYWGGTRSNVPERFPAVVTKFRSRRHILTFDFALLEKLGFKIRYPFALTAWEDIEGIEKARAENVKSGAFQDVAFQNGFSLHAREANSFPPLEAVCLFGDARIDTWLKELGLERWQYEKIDREIETQFNAVFQQRCPLYSDPTVFAQLGGWQITWPDDDYYLPREMNLLCWTFRDSEPWQEIFLTQRGNIVVKERIT